MKRDKPRAPVSLPAIPVGNCMLFGVDQVNGPSSVRKKVPISKHEALVLARYWIEEHEDCLYWHRIQYSSRDYRIMLYASSRIDELYDMGLITREQIADLLKAVQAKNIEAPPETEPPSAHAAKPRNRPNGRPGRSR